MKMDDALGQLAPHIGGVHCKDALPSHDPSALGTEVPIGRGAVDFPAILRKLRAIGYRAPLVIEREHGPNVLEDVLAAKTYLEALLRQTAYGGGAEPADGPAID